MEENNHDGKNITSPFCKKFNIGEYRPQIEQSFIVFTNIMWKKFTTKSGFCYG
jgi:hypothetical protein